VNDLEALAGKLERPGVGQVSAAKPVAAEAVSEITDEQIVAALKACDKEDVTQEGWIWRQRIRWGRAVLALAAPIAQPAAALKGRAAIVAAWKDLPEEIRQCPDLSKLWEALGDCEDATPAAEPDGYLEHTAFGDFLAYSASKATPQTPLYTLDKARAILAWGSTAPEAGSAK
jgi:hypothetical protein